MSGRIKIAIILVLLVVGGAGLFLFTKSTQQPTDIPPVTDDMAGDDMAATDFDDAPPPPPEEEMAPPPEEITGAEQPAAVDPAAAPVEEAAALSASAATIDLDAALSERRIGDANAPVTIQEFASLTCSHCAQFHTTTFPDLKTQLIDTGKASLVMSEFPLNKPALDATMVARCLPADRYFSFVGLLFEKQADWAGDANYTNFLKQNAQLAGLSAEQFDACINNETLRNTILDRMKEAQTKHNVQSTPTFVVGESNVISGAMPLEVYVKAVEDAIAAKNNPAPAPEAEQQPAAEEAPAEPPVEETGAPE
ncbi:MAG TPA: hypothetical protein DEA55_10225 [Rhodospirillaceae bacterium]|nr:hypothetical protein [Rhodospirillaceae bacterium]